MKTTEESVQKNAIRNAFLLKRKKIAKIDNETFLKKKENLLIFLTQLLKSISSENIKDMSIGGYRSLQGEVPLEEFYRSLAYTCSFPKVNTKAVNTKAVNTKAVNTKASSKTSPETKPPIELAFYKVSKEALTSFNLNNLKYWSKSDLGVFEPNLAKESFSPKVLLIPGIAFDKNFMRLGFGGGFYDKFLKNYLGIKIGISFSDYIFEKQLPAEDHDIAMDFIVTDNCILQKTNSLKTNSLKIKE